MSITLRAPIQVSFDRILKEAADVFDVRQADIIGKDRHKTVGEARVVVFAIARELTRASFPELGRKMGRRDHTTAMSACSRAKYLSTHDLDFAWRAHEVWKRCIGEELETKLSKVLAEAEDLKKQIAQLAPPPQIVETTGEQARPVLGECPAFFEETG